MTDLSFQGLVPSNFLFLPYPTNLQFPQQQDTATTPSALGPSKTTPSWSPSLLSNTQYSPPLTTTNGGFKQFSPGVKIEEVDMTRYLRQLAECKLKELEFQKAQVQLLKESLPMYPIATVPPMNFVPYTGSSADTTSSCCLPAQCLKNLPLHTPTTPIVPSPVLLSSYPNLSPFASCSAPPTTTSSPSSLSLSNLRVLDVKPTVHPISEVINLFPARKTFICPELGCGKALKTRLGLERHARNHSGGRRYICTAKGCNKKFLESNTLKRHSRIHTGEKPFLCAHAGCGRSFSDGSNYRRHLSTHSKDKPFKCPFHECKVKPYGFTRAATLRTHLLNFHNVKTQELLIQKLN